MPEIGEVARIVHFLRQNIVGKSLSKVTAQHDENVFGKVGCSAAKFEEALSGKKVVGARQQGKYFWLEMSSPPHPLMHFGMAGWMKMKGIDTYYHKSTEPKEEEWPPKYWKFILETKEEPKAEAAFVDFRRFARIRLIDCPADEIRSHSPLVENGPDPVQDRDVVSVQWLTDKLASKRIPIKALLLDQGNISGIGNWVGDELLYHAKIHPEQYSNTLTKGQIVQLHKSLHYVCGFAVDNLSDSSIFPEEWLFKHRWGKGKKEKVNVLPNGQRFVYLTVGGRTSCVVPSVQKKTGPVAGDIKDEDGSEGSAEDEAIKEKPKKEKVSKSKSKPVKEESLTLDSAIPDESILEKKGNGKTPRKRKSDVNDTTQSPTLKKVKLKQEKAILEDSLGRRRSARLSVG